MQYEDVGRIVWVVCSGKRLLIFFGYLLTAVNLQEF